MINFQPKHATEIWTKKQSVALYQYLHNGNPKNRYVMAWREEDGSKKYARGKKHPAERIITWAWATMEGKKDPGKRIAFVPYSQNEDGLSRWGCLDFDAHDGQCERAEQFAFSAFRHLLNSAYFIILESSGSGWHVWAIAQEFRPVHEWALFLRQVAKAVEAPIEAGICEIFPTDSTQGGFGKGVRVPGSWNPGTDTLNEIYYENIGPLIEELVLSGKRNNSSLSLPRYKERNISSSSLPTPAEDREYIDWGRKWAKQFLIVQCSTRNDRLCALVGEVFNQVGFEMAKRLITLQFKEAIVAMQASLDEHLKEFEASWAGLLKKWREGLTAEESKLYDGLNTENKQDAFRIIRSFARKAAQDGAPDFPIARDDLAARIGVTGKGAGHVRDELSKREIIIRTAEYIPNKKAARYRWLPELGKN